MAHTVIDTLKNHPVVSSEQWLSARKALLAKEKEFTWLRDELNRQRRALPWEKITKDYIFDGPEGKETLSQLFGKHSQLIVYHFMFGPGWEEGCPHCSFWADHFDGMAAHLNQRDVSFAVISRAPLDEIEVFQRRMDWQFKWLSSFHNTFNYDFHVSFMPEEIEQRTALYNYVPGDPGDTDREGISVFYKDASGALFHTYSAYARGIDMLNTTYHFLDLLPKGRDETGFESPQDWVRHHDRYEE